MKLHFWVTYSDYKIVLTNPVATFGIIFGILCIIISITLKRTNNKYFDLSTTTAMKGVAVLVLIFGHFSMKCLKNEMFFESGGYWAVIIFLFLSGYGLYQSYNLDIVRNAFWKKRISKLYIPLWITLVLFIILDHFLINLNHQPIEIILNFIGIHLNNILIRVNAVAWFVEYIMVLYTVYWIVSKIRLPEEFKLLLLFSLCVLVSATVYLTPIKKYHSIWLEYTLVFPTGVLFSKYQNSVTAFLKNMIKNQLYLIIPALSAFVIFYKWNSLFSFRGNQFFKPLALILAIVIIALPIESINLQSKFLIFLGKYSFEIYLLHAPFMVKYDFFLHRDPLYVYFFAYFISLLFLSFLLAKASNTIYAYFFVVRRKT